MSSNIQDFYANKTILITGGTGFVGSYLVEKLLRSCLGVKKIYLLMRPKPNKSSQERLKELMEESVYNSLRESNLDVFKKLTLLEGDLEISGLGLSDQDLENVINEVNCIFHVGATVKFTEKLQRAIMINIHGTDTVIKISKKIKNLQCLVYVSTAYANSTRDETEEIFYGCVEDSDTLIKLAQTMDCHRLNKITPGILGDWYNTYVFTKHVAEDIIRKNIDNLPIAVVRPSIITYQYREPKSYRISGLDSYSMVTISLNLGIIHTMNCNLKDITDIVPVDIVVNSIIAAGWFIGTTGKANKPSSPIFNCVSGQQNPITWARQEELLIKNDVIMPSMKKVFHRVVIYSTNKFLLFLIDLFFLQWLYFVNLRSFLYRDSFKIFKIYAKVKKLQKTVEPFISKEWTFKGNNSKLMWDALSKEDQDVFNFDIKSIDWGTHYNKTAYEIRKNFLKDSSTFEEAQRKVHFLKMLFYFYVLLFLFVFCMTIICIAKIF